MSDRLREHAEMLHAEHHSGTFVPTLDACGVHTVEDYLALAHEVREEPRHSTLQQEWALIAGEITATSSVSSIEAGRAVDTAHRRLVERAAKEGRVLRRPVMARVVVEAWTEEA